MSTTTKLRIEIPASLIRDVRLGAISQLSSNAEMLGANADKYYASEEAEAHGVAYHDYCDAFDAVRSWLSLLDDLGDDFRVEEPVANIKPTYADKVSRAATERADLLRGGLSDHDVDNGGIPGSELVALAKRIEALEKFADYVEATGQMYDATRGGGEEEEN
jgi:hypothetical protein